MVNEKREPKRFGPWRKGPADPERPWAWLCDHERTGEKAIVELHFGGPSLGLQLREAVAANSALVPLGAEQLLQTDRLVLRSSEGWANQPDGLFLYWVARGVSAEGAPPLLTKEATLQALVRYRDLLQVADRKRLKVSPQPSDIVLKKDLSLEVRRVGLPTLGTEDPESVLLQVLRRVAAEPEVSAALSRATGVDDLLATGPS